MNGITKLNTKFDTLPVAHASPCVFARSLKAETSAVTQYEAGQTPKPAISAMRFETTPRTLLIGQYCFLKLLKDLPD
jgi:hypothetical protein